MADNKTNEYYLPCVKCPFCQEIVEAKVIETVELKKIYCPACKTGKEYKVNR